MCLVIIRNMSAVYFFRLSISNCHNIMLFYLFCLGILFYVFFLSFRRLSIHLSGFFSSFFHVFFYESPPFILSLDHLFNNSIFYITFFHFLYICSFSSLLQLSLPQTCFMNHRSICHTR